MPDSDKAGAAREEYAAGRLHGRTQSFHERRDALGGYGSTHSAARS
jgi:hypothetical protein